MPKDSLRHPYLLLALTFVGFIALGLPDALIGVAWPAIRADFELPLSALGPLYIATTAGYVIASSATGALLARIGIGTLLALSCAFTAVALFGYTLAPSWAVLVALGLFTGFGGGAIDAAINTHAAVQYSTRLVNVLHAFYGVGAALGPALMTATLVRGHDWRNGYWIVVAVEVALALAFISTGRQWPPSVVHRSDQRPASLLETVKLGRVRLSMLVFLIYTGCEAAAGAWVFSLFYEARDFETTSAGIAVSLYWCGLFASRVGYAFLPVHTRPGTVITLSIIGALVGMVVVALNFHPIIDIIAITLVGFASGPIFPCMIATTPARLGPRHTANAVGAQISIAAVGLAAFPALCGLIAQGLGLESIPILLAGSWAVLLAAYGALERMGHHEADVLRG
jgi:fucose permease